jgi:hypothetical protein
MNGIRRLTGLEILFGALLMLGAGVGVGVGVEDQLDARQSASTAKLVNADRERERGSWALEKTRLTDTIEQERKHHADENRKRDVHLSAFTSHAARVRDDLQAKLSDSRADGQACIARAAGIAEGIGELAEIAVEGDGLLQEAARENERLAAENGKLGEQIRGLIANYRENHPERVTVTAAKR